MVGVVTYYARAAESRDTVTNFVSSLTFCCLGLLCESFVLRFLVLDYDESLQNLKNIKIVSHVS